MRGAIQSSVSPQTSFKKPTNCLGNSEIHGNLNSMFPAKNCFPWSRLGKQFLAALRPNMLFSSLCVYCTGCFWTATHVPCSAASSVLIVHEIALNTAVHETTHTNVLCSTKQTDFKNKLIGMAIKEKSPRKCLQIGPFLEPLCHLPWSCLPVGYNLQMWRVPPLAG